MSGDTTRGRNLRTGTRGDTARSGETRTHARARTRGIDDTRRRRIQRRRQLRRARERAVDIARSLGEAVTPLGWFVLALGIVSAVLGATQSWVEAWFVAVVCGILLLAAIPFLIGSRAYAIGIEMDRNSVVAGSLAEVRVNIENATARPALPAVVELPVGRALRELTVPFIGPHGKITLTEEVPAPDRGVIRVGPLTIARRDPLGLLRREVTWPERHTLYVHPKTTPLPPHSAGLVRDLEGAASRRLTDSDLAFHAVREYAPGDEMRHVHWKSTAKTGQLMVRQYEESQTARVAVLFDAKPDEYVNAEEFELGVSVAASIAVQAVREGRERFVASAWAPGRVRPSIDGLEELPSRDPQQMLNAWSELRRAPEALPVEALAASLAHSRRPLSIVTIVTGSQPDAKRLRRAAVSFSPDIEVLVLRCALHAEPQAQRADQLRLFTVGALGDLPQLMFRSGL